MIKTVLCLIALIAFSFAVVDRCTGNAACNIINPTQTNTIETKRCDILNGTCSTLNGVAWKTAVKNPLTEYCSDSFDAGVTCVKYAAEGCSTPALGSFAFCFPGLLSTDGKCTAPPKANATYVEENQECDVTKQTYCKKGFACLRGICRKRLAAGSVCNGNVPCREEFNCDFGKCVQRFTLDEGTQAEHGSTCKSGRVQSNVCTPVSRAPCYSNADCTHGSVCKRDNFENDQTGVCINLPHYYNQELTSCMASCSGSDIKTEEDCTSCVTAGIKMLCSQQCMERRDKRLIGSAHKFDCAALTMTPFSSSECEIGEQFLNCDAVYSWSSASSISFGLISIIALFAFLF